MDIDIGHDCNDQDYDYDNDYERKLMLESSTLIDQLSADESN